MMTTRTGSSSSAAATLERTAGEEAIAVETRQPPTQKLMPSDPSPQPSDRQKPKRWLQAIGVVTVAALAIYVGYRWWSSARNWVTTDNAYVAAHIHTISSRLAGTVQEVLVDENQEVASGSVLARLDTSDFEVKRQQAQAQRAQANAQFQRAEAQIAQAHAEIAREQAVATRAHQDFKRAESLFQGVTGAISKQEFDQAKSESDAADARLAAAQSALTSATALVMAAQAEEKVAQASLRDAELQLSYTEIKAPTAGRIGKKSLETGNRIQPGQALLALVEPDVWVTANFKETQLDRIKLGQHVSITVDALPDRPLKGTVHSLAPASGAQFALLPPDNATGNFTKIVQRVPVKIVLDRQSLADCEGRIVPGMSAVVEVKVRE